MKMSYVGAALAASLGVLLAGCAGNDRMVTAQSATSSNRPLAGAQPPSAAASATPSPGNGSTGMKGMDHSAMGNMQEMDHSKMGSMKGMEHSQSAQKSATAQDVRGASHGNHSMGHSAGGGHGSSAAGKPGVATQAARTINVVALDTMRFDPQTLTVKAGETVRFVVTNKGRLPHEFVVGTTEEQKEHEKMMQNMPGMKHEDANSITLAPGETKNLVWQFGQSGVVELGCHIPGHYPAGMMSKVTVTGAANR